MSVVKILYAANNRNGSYFQLKRFLRFTKNKNFIIKIAAFKDSLLDINVDWTLDSLLNAFSVDNINISFKNNNFKRYLKQIEEYKPDIIISDLEIFTSYIAIELGIPVWQVSPILIYYAFDHELKYKLDILTSASYAFNQNKRHKEYTNFIINNSTKRFIYSHFCDLEGLPIKDSFNWIRPYYFLSSYEGNKNKFIGSSLENNKDILKYMIDKPNSKYFTNFVGESYENIKLFHLNNIDEYKNSLSDCRYLLSTGETSLLADAFYNRKKSIVFPNLTDKESIINFKLSEYFNLGSAYFNEHKIDYPNPDVFLNEKVLFLNEEIEERCI